MGEALITREEAWAFIRQQFDGNTPGAKANNRMYLRSHYGKVELRELLDQIYGPYDGQNTTYGTTP